MTHPTIYEQAQWMNKTPKNVAKLTHHSIEEEVSFLVCADFLFTTLWGLNDLGYPTASQLIYILMRGV